MLQVLEQQLRGRYPTLSWRSEPQNATGPWDGAATLTFGERALRFVIEVKLHPQLAHVPAIAGRPVESGIVRMLVAPHLPEKIVARCHELGVACMDLNGRAWVEADGVLIDHARETNIHYSPPQAGRDYFSGKASRVARALFARERWTHSELVKATGNDGAQVSRVLEAMIHDGLVARDGVSGTRGSKFFAIDREQLLDAWTTRDPWPRRVQVMEYSVLSANLDEIAAIIQNAIPNAAFTQWFAASKRHPYADVPVVSAYVPRLPEAAMLEALVARVVPANGRLRLLVPDDDGVFQFARTVSGLTLVSDVQIYLDVIHAGLRGDEAAAALRAWDGFCR